MAAGLRIGFIEPHLLRYGGIRRVVEFSNRLVARGHSVTFYLPPGEPRRCTWMPCRADVRSMPEGFTDELDVVIFNHEPQWYLPFLFERAGSRVFYALHDGASYDKEGSWEAARTNVDLRLANSGWTADRIAAATGERPHVVLGGVNDDHFRPVDVPKRYPVLCVGDSRQWKGTDTIRAAATRLGLPVETYASKNLPQGRMAAEYCSAEVFVVGSRVEGFGQPGLEALACGVPLVTTDNGGCREYAVHGETALVVPADDPDAMADAIAALRADRDLAARLRANGLQLVAEQFDWERATDRLERHLLHLTSGPCREPPPLAQALTRGGETAAPRLSVVIPAWDQLVYTMRCVESLRQHTDVPFELVIVDNGSRWEAAAYAEASADIALLNDHNRGFAVAMNQGLAAVRGEHVAFLNNDTQLPARWASRLLETAARRPAAGIVVPAVTEARNPRTVRQTPGTDVETLAPFEAPPAAVLYLMPTALIRELGGWGEEFLVAAGEDVDLAFKVWVNELDIAYDSRVLVQHVGKGTAAVKLPNWRQIWDGNRQLMLAKWSDPGLVVPRVSSCPSERHARNLLTARSVAQWMDRYFTLRGKAHPGRQTAQRASGVASALLARPRARQALLAAWRFTNPLLPDTTRTWASARLGRVVRRHAMRD